MVDCSSPTQLHILWYAYPTRTAISFYVSPRSSPPSHSSLLFTLFFFNSSFFPSVKTSLMISPRYVMKLASPCLQAALPHPLHELPHLPLIPLNILILFIYIISSISLISIIFINIKFKSMWLIFLRYLGCYQDSGSPRDLNGPDSFPNPNGPCKYIPFSSLSSSFCPSDILIILISPMLPILSPARITVHLRWSAEW